jgi:hypothetical protein
VEHDVRGRVELADPIRQSRQRNVNRARQVTPAPLFGAPHVDDLNAIPAGKLIEAWRIELRDRCQISVT